jgi:hypothetical protein
VAFTGRGGESASNDRKCLAGADTPRLMPSLTRFPSSGHQLFKDRSRPNPLFGWSLPLRIDGHTHLRPGFLHKDPQPRWGHLAAGDVPQGSCPFANGLAIDVLRRAANDGRNGIRIPVEGQPSKFE